MATSLAKLREKLQTKIFEGLGSSGTLLKVSYTTDKWGDGTSTLSSSTAITVVPYDSVSSQDFQPFADLQSGEVTMVIPYDTVFDDNDMILYNGVNYIIKETVDYPYKDGALAYAVRLSNTSI